MTLSLRSRVLVSVTLLDSFIEVKPDFMAAVSSSASDTSPDIHFAVSFTFSVTGWLKVYFVSPLYQPPNT